MKKRNNLMSVVKPLSVLAIMSAALFTTAYGQSGNVGIGTNKPSSKLTVNGNTSIGSGYAGTPAPADGAIIQGNVGVGTSAPTSKLHVEGGVRIVDGTQGAGKIFVSDANGLGSWQTSPATKSVIFGDLAAGGASVPPNGTRVQTGSSIALPPGKWIVNVVMLIQIADANLPNGRQAWVQTAFSDAPYSTALSSDVQVNGSQNGIWVSGGMSGPSYFGLVNGSMIINNTSASTKRYYYFAHRPAVVNGGTGYTSSFGGDAWGENQLYAIPVN